MRAVTRPFEDALRDELMAATRRRPRRRARAGLAAVALVVGGLVAASLATDSQPASADVEVTHEDGRVIVRLTDLENTAADVEAATDAEGLDVRVEAVAAGPSQVGRFVGDVSTDGDVRDVERFEVDGVTFTAFSIPEGWTGTLTLFLGRAAAPDEPYQSSADAFAIGEPLACSDALGAPLASIVQLLDGLDVAVLVFADGQVLPQMTLSEAIETGHGNDPITGAAAVSSTKVVVDVGRSVPPEAPEPC